MGSRQNESGASLPRMRMSPARLFASLLAALTAAACASNEPASTTLPGAGAPASTEANAASPTSDAPPPTPSAAPDPAPSPASTTAPSPTSATAAKTCNYGGKTHAVGDKFPSTDGCNTCVCEEKGVACTEKACAKEAACDPAKEPNREYKMRNADQCKAALFRCPDGKKAFFNACGCGCE